MEDKYSWEDIRLGGSTTRRRAEGMVEAGAPRAADQSSRWPSNGAGRFGSVGAAVGRRGVGGCKGRRVGDEE